MISDHNLIGWLVFILIQDGEYDVPDDVLAELSLRGWVETTDEGLHLTEAGNTIFDLNSAEWGVNAPELAQ